MVASGDLIGERYRLDEPLADGGMSDVWRATDQVLGREVAVKLLHPALLAEPGFAARFRAEAQMMAALRHPGVVEVYDYGDTTDQPDGVAYLVMAHVDGQPLATRIAEAGRLSAGETLSIVAQAARALHAAHSAGIVHRDVKPANLLVEEDGKVVLVDFGVARAAGATSHTGLNEVIGTALYMAPEQVAKRTLSPATDVYALGAVAYHCLAGRPPFTGNNPVQVALRHLESEPPPLPADVPEPVQALVRRAMAKDPADRFPDAAAFAAAVEAIVLAGAPEVAGPAAGLTGPPRDPTGHAAGPVDPATAAAGLAAGAAGPAAARIRPAGGFAPPADGLVPPAGGSAQPAGGSAPSPGGAKRTRERARRHLPAVAVMAALLGLIALAIMFRPVWDAPAVPDPDRPSTGPASVGTGTARPGGGAPGALTSPPGSGTASPGATPTNPPGPAVTTARTTGAPAPPASPPPPSAAPTLLPTGLPTLLPTSIPAISP